MSEPVTTNSQARRRAWTTETRLLAVVLSVNLAVLMSSVGSMAQGVPTGLAEVGRLTPDEVQKIQRKQAMTKSHDRIRALFSRGEYQAVITEIDNAQKIDPNDAVLKMYRKWAEEKLIGAESPVESTPEVPRTVEASDATGLVPPSTPAGAGQTPLPAIDTAVSSPTPETAAAATPSSTAAPTSAAEPPAQAPTASPIKKILLLMIVAGALAIGWLAFSKVTTRRKAETVVSKPAAAPPPDKKRPGMQKPEMKLSAAAAENAPENEADLAAGIAQSISSMSLTSEPPPTFDIFIPTSGEANPEVEAFHESMPTLVDHGDEMHAGPGAEPFAPPAEPVGSVQPPATPPAFTSSLPDTPEQAPVEPSAYPSLDDFLKPAEPRLSPPASPSAIQPPAPADQPAIRPSTKAVSFDDLGITFPTEPPAAPPPAGKPGSEPTPAGEKIVLPPREPLREPISLSPLSDVSRQVSPPGAAPNAPASPSRPAGAINLDDLMLDTIAGFSGGGEPAGPPPKRDLPIVSLASEAETIGLPSQLQSPAQPLSTPSAPVLGETASMAMPPPGEIRLAEPSAPPSVSDTFHSGETIQLDMSGDAPAAQEADLTATRTTAIPPASPAPAPPPATGGEPPVQHADERSERMFKDQYQKGTLAYQNKNWKQAIHHLAIAAALHPENEEVRNQLRDAREQKRREEAGG